MCMHLDLLSTQGNGASNEHVYSPHMQKNRQYKRQSKIETFTVVQCITEKHTFQTTTKHFAKNT